VCNLKKYRNIIIAASSFKNLATAKAEGKSAELLGNSPLKHCGEAGQGG